MSTSTKPIPIWLATHPRSCSTAFERVFMTCREALQCLHEPFGNAFYYGPERLSPRFENDEQTRLDSGFSDTTYQKVFDRIDDEGKEGKRVFIKDMSYYLFPPNRKPASIAPSLQRVKRGIGTNGDVHGHTFNNGAIKTQYPYDTLPEAKNPTIVPKSLLEHFHFTFLIRDPHSSIPSYYRCTVPPLEEMTGFHDFYPSEAGYDELRLMFEFLQDEGIVGPHHVTGWNNSANNLHSNGVNKGKEICVVDADDLLDDPYGILETYCKSVGFPFTPEMLSWDNDEDQTYAKAVFAKWKGFHEDVIDSTGLAPRVHKKKEKSEIDWDREWTDKFGLKAAKVIRETVDANMSDYLFMKQFALKAHALS